MTTTKQLLTHTYRIQDHSFDYVPDHIRMVIQDILNQPQPKLEKALKQLEHNKTKED